ncbi:MAG: alkaline shock response membrane anchor protein AmaP [Bacillota bacterium]
MGIIDRVVLSLYALALTVVSFMVLLTSLGWDAPVNLIIDTLRMPTGRTTTGIISGLIFLAGLRFIYYGFKRPPAQAVVHDTGMGEVNISLVAVKSLVTRVASRTPGVREVRARVRLNPLGNGIEVELDLKVASDANMPDLADKVQKATSSYVHDIVGVTVDSVKVSVSDISLEGRR